MANDAQSLDIAAVETYLKAHLPGFSGPLTAEKFADGQSNPTFRLSTASASYVLRRKPPGTLLKSAHAVDREFRVQKALSGSDVPVATVHLLCEDPDIIGSSFYVMDHVPGRIFFDPRLPEVDKPERSRIINDMNRVLAAIHSISLETVGLADFGPPGNYIARQTGRWSQQYLASATEDIPAMTALIAGLQERLDGIEGDGERTLVHGDYRIDNMIFSPKEPRCLAVLDWELSTIGHPLADLASVIMQWQLPPGPEGRGLAGVDRRELGLPSDEEFIANYCERRGIPRIDDFGFYLAFCFFRMAAVLQGVKKRALDGNASNPERGLKMGAYVPVFAKKGLESLGNG
ncbi:MAG: phosphotransferase family protein [Rhodobacter sp.]|nr:phosphotransferase family protein [Rhodobacter sp.]